MDRTAPPAAASVSMRTYRLTVASRLLAAGLGGYVLASAGAAFLALALPTVGVPRADAVLGATMMAFVIHAIVALWAFAAASGRRLWLGLAGLGLPLLIAVWRMADAGGAP